MTALVLSAGLYQTPHEWLLLCLSVPLLLLFLAQILVTRFAGVPIPLLKRHYHLAGLVAMALLVLRTPDTIGDDQGTHVYSSQALVFIRRLHLYPYEYAICLWTWSNFSALHQHSKRAIPKFMKTTLVMASGVIVSLLLGLDIALLAVWRQEHSALSLAANSVVLISVAFFATIQLICYARLRSSIHTHLDERKRAIAAQMSGDTSQTLQQRVSPATTGGRILMSSSLPMHGASLATTAAITATASATPRHEPRVHALDVLPVGATRPPAHGQLASRPWNPSMDYTLEPFTSNSVRSPSSHLGKEGFDLRTLPRGERVASTHQADQQGQARTSTPVQALALMRQQQPMATLGETPNPPIAALHRTPPTMVRLLSSNSPESPMRISSNLTPPTSGPLLPHYPMSASIPPHTAAHIDIRILRQGNWEQIMDQQEREHSSTTAAAATAGTDTPKSNRGLSPRLVAQTATPEHGKFETAGPAPGDTAGSMGASDNVSPSGDGTLDWPEGSGCYSSENLTITPEAPTRSLLVNPHASNRTSMHSSGGTSALLEDTDRPLISGDPLASHKRVEAVGPQEAGGCPTPPQRHSISGAPDSPQLKSHSVPTTPLLVPIKLTFAHLLSGSSSGGPPLPNRLVPPDFRSSLKRPRASSSASGQVSELAAEHAASHHAAAMEKAERERLAALSSELLPPPALHLLPGGGTSISLVHPSSTGGGPLHSAGKFAPRSHSGMVASSPSASPMMVGQARETLIGTETTTSTHGSTSAHGVAAHVAHGGTPRGTLVVGLQLTPTTRGRGHLQMHPSMDLGMLASLGAFNTPISIPPSPVGALNRLSKKVRTVLGVTAAVTERTPLDARMAETKYLESRMNKVFHFFLLSWSLQWLLVVGLLCSMLSTFASSSDWCHVFDYFCLAAGLTLFWYSFILTPATLRTCHRSNWRWNLCITRNRTARGVHDAHTLQQAAANGGHGGGFHLAKQTSMSFRLQRQESRGGPGGPTPGVGGGGGVVGVGGFVGGGETDREVSVVGFASRSRRHTPMLGLSASPVPRRDSCHGPAILHDWSMAAANAIAGSNAGPSGTGVSGGHPLDHVAEDSVPDKVESSPSASRPTTADRLFPHNADARFRKLLSVVPDESSLVGLDRSCTPGTDDEGEHGPMRVRSGLPRTSPRMVPLLHSGRGGKDASQPCTPMAPDHPLDLESLAEQLHQPTDAPSLAPPPSHSHSASHDASANHDRTSSHPPPNLSPSPTRMTFPRGAVKPSSRSPFFHQQQQQQQLQRPMTPVRLHTPEPQLSGIHAHDAGDPLVHTRADTLEAGAMIGSSLDPPTISADPPARVASAPPLACVDESLSVDRIPSDPLATTDSSRSSYNRASANHFHEQTSPSSASQQATTANAAVAGTGGSGGVGGGGSVSPPLASGRKAFNIVVKNGKGNGGAVPPHSRADGTQAASGAVGAVAAIPPPVDAAVPTAAASSTGEPIDQKRLPTVASTAVPATTQPIRISVRHSV